MASKVPAGTLSESLSISVVWREWSRPVVVWRVQDIQVQRRPISDAGDLQRCQPSGCSSATTAIYGWLLARPQLAPLQPLEHASEEFVAKGLSDCYPNLGCCKYEAPIRTPRAERTKLKTIAWVLHFIVLDAFRRLLLRLAARRTHWASRCRRPDA